MDKRNNKKGIKRMVLLFVGFISFFAIPSYGKEKVEGAASVSIMSSYVWRGFQLSEYDPVIQPSIGINYKGVGFSLWSNYWDKNISETDITIDYSDSFKNLDYSIGYIFYALDNTEDTQEIYTSFSYDTLFSPTLSVYWDFDETDSVYTSFSIGHDFSLYKVNLATGALISYYFYDDFRDDWQNCELNLSTSIPVGPFSIDPIISYSFGLYTGDFGDVGDEFYGGITISLNF
jgi:outer membrane usher protein FimD/PapC